MVDQMLCFLMLYRKIRFSSVAQSCPTLCDPMNHSIPGLPVHHQLLEFTQTPSNQWCHSAISSSVIPFSSCPQSLPASESFPMSQLFAWGGQSTGVSALASFLSKNTQGWSPLEWTGLVGSPCSSRDSQESSPKVFIKPFNYFSFFSITSWCIDLDYCDIEWIALDMNRDNSVIFETASKYCISDSFVD